jgi:hypothetical protein
MINAMRSLAAVSDLFSFAGLQPGSKQQANANRTTVMTKGTVLIWDFIVSQIEVSASCSKAPCAGSRFEKKTGLLGR